ncbi:MAG TPA: radical SAM protein [Rhizomicrobium sp.]|nr:radical SAM protein [Rhizomicrobium sp.]
MFYDPSLSVLAMSGSHDLAVDVVLIAPKEFEASSSQRTYREKNFTSFIDRMGHFGFQKDYVRRINEALGLECLATYLRESGLKVAIVNCNLAPMGSRAIADLVAASGARLVGISLIYRPQVAQAIELTQLLPRDVTVAMGGALASFMKHELLSCLPGLDAIVFGEAEETFRAFAASVIAGGEIKGLPGVAFRDGAHVVVTPADKPLDLGLIRAPQRDSLAYLNAVGRAPRIASLYTSRGCMAKCTFCTGKDAYNVERRRTYRFRDPVAVVDEMETLTRSFGTEFFYINDDNFLGYGNKSERRVEKFASEIIARNLNIEFATECRVDGLDRDLLHLLKEAGMVQMLLGLESGSDAVLKRWRKGATAEQNREAVRTVKALGINVEPGFILVDAHTTPDEIAENISFIRETGLDRTPFPTYLINRLSVYPGTEIEQTLTASGVLARSQIAVGMALRDDPGAILREFERLEYRSVEPRVEVFWRGLRQGIEPIEQIIEDVLPTTTGLLLVARDSGDKTRRRLASDCIKQIVKWRRDVGRLILQYIEIGHRSFEEASAAVQLRRFRSALKEMRAEYDRMHLGSGMQDWLAFIESRFA